MNYATNTHHPDLHKQITLWLNKPSIVKDSAKWLLIDAGLIEQDAFVKLMKPYQDTYLHNVFIKSRFEVYGLYAPHLFRIDQLENQNQSEFLTDLLKLCNGIPALALLDACDDAASLGNCLAWFAQTYTPDGLELYCRIADTRITPGLVQVLDEEQKLKLGQNILQWQVVNRMGALEALLPNIKPQHEDDKTPFRKFASGKAFTLSDVQFKVMMDKAEPDELFNMLLESNSDLVPDKERGLFYQRISKNVARAHQHNIVSSADLMVYTVIALTTQDKFDDHPTLAETWKAIKEKGASFSKLVNAWPDKIWEELSQTATN